MLSQPHSKNLFPNIQREPPVFQFVPIASCPITGNHQKEPGSNFFAASLQVFMCIDKIPFEPSLHSEKSQPFLTGAILQSSVFFMSFFRSLSSVSVSLLYWEAHSWTQHSSCDLTSAEWKELHQLAILCPMQPMVPFAFFATKAHSWLSRTPRSFSDKVLPSGVVPTGAWGCPLPASGLHTFPC